MVHIVNLIQNGVYILVEVSIWIITKSGPAMASHTVNMVIFTWGKIRENVGNTFHKGVIFTILLLFPS